ncbi:unnamed protein product [Anisakis simplex]|uniref:DUF4817 domain-containing protein n=1 Tax=Anisakis simplex TaxID=6269 RepID=A0A0M3K165_ANISI|nr:unnamed protein product [Anisakis simplex]
MGDHEQENTITLPAHMRCAAYTWNLIALKDTKKAVDKIVFKRVHKSALAKAISLWNHQNQSTTTADTVYKELGVRERPVRRDNDRPRTLVKANLGTTRELVSEFGVGHLTVHCGPYANTMPYVNANGDIVESKNSFLNVILGIFSFIMLFFKTLFAPFLGSQQQQFNPRDRLRNGPSSSNGLDPNRRWPRSGGPGGPSYADEGRNRRQMGRLPRSSGMSMPPMSCAPGG